MKNPVQTAKLLLYGMHNGVAVPVELAPDGGLKMDIIFDDSFDHGELLGLTDDDHTQYLALAGRGTSPQTVLKGILLNGPYEGGVFALNVITGGIKITAGGLIVSASGASIAGGLTLTGDAVVPTVAGELRMGSDEMLRIFAKASTGAPPAAAHRVVLTSDDDVSVAGMILVWDDTYKIWMAKSVSGDLALSDIGGATVNGIQGSGIVGGAAAESEILIGQSTGLTWLPLSGDVTMAATGAATVRGIQNAIFPAVEAGIGPGAKKIIIASATNVLGWKELSGDVTLNNSDGQAKVVGIQNAAIANTPDAGKVLRATATTALSWETEPLTPPGTADGDILVWDNNASEYNAVALSGDLAALTDTGVAEVVGLQGVEINNAQADHTILTVVGSALAWSSPASFLTMADIGASDGSGSGSSGDVGEYKEAYDEIVLTTENTWQKVADMVLYPGDWDVSGVAVFRGKYGATWEGLYFDSLQLCVASNDGGTPTSPALGINLVKDTAAYIPVASQAIPRVRVLLPIDNTVNIATLEVATNVGYIVIGTMPVPHFVVGLNFILASSTHPEMDGTYEVASWNEETQELTFAVTHSNFVPVADTGTVESTSTLGTTYSLWAQADNWAPDATHELYVYGTINARRMR